MDDGVDDLVAGQPGLDQDAAPPPARRPPTRRAARASRASACSPAVWRGASSSWSKSRKATTSAPGHPVEHRLGADQDGALGHAAVVAGRHLGHRPAGQQLELLRARVTPTRRAFIRVAPQAGTPTGRVGRAAPAAPAAARRASATRPRTRSHRASSPQATHASSGPAPCG